jgi:hypothetical protein
MKAIPLLLIGLASLMRAQPLQPVSTIDFSQALRVPPNHRFTVIGALGATPDGPIVSHGMGCDGYDPGIARANKIGSNITRIDLPAPYRHGGDIIPMPDGSWWLQTSSGPGLPAVTPCIAPGSPPTHGVVLSPSELQGFRPASANPGGGSGNVPVQNFDLFASDGKHVESFRELGAGNLSRGGAPSPAHIIPGARKIALASPGLIRVGHVANDSFVSDREWHIASSYVIIPLESDRFGVVNRFSGQLTVIDPATPDTRVFETQMTAANARTRSLVAGANGSIWFLLRNASANAPDLVQFAPDGKVLSRNTLRLPAGFKPFKLAVSGRDVYLAGFSATVYRYELP